MLQTVASSARRSTAIAAPCEEADDHMPITDTDSHMPKPFVPRRMVAADAEQAAALVATTFADLDARKHARRPDVRPDRPDVRPDVSSATVDDTLARTIARLTQTDSDGCWAVAGAGRLIGIAVAIRREMMWGLSLLIVDPKSQGRGVGRALLARAVAYGASCPIKMIMASEDPRAARAYRGLGLTLHPAMRAQGVPKRIERRASHVRAGQYADLALVDEVDRRRRGASRASDVEWLLDEGASILVSEDGEHRGYAVHRAGRDAPEGQPILLGADSEDLARDLLRQAFAARTGEVKLYGLTRDQQWAIDVAFEAGLEVLPGPPVFLSEAYVPPGPWLLSGIYF